MFQEDEEGSEQPDVELSQENNMGISEEKVRRAVSWLKGGKASDMCGIMPEMHKAGGEVAIEWLVKLFNVEQGGVRSGRGCIDQVFAVKQVIEEMIEKGRVMFMVFIDLEKAYMIMCVEKSCGEFCLSMHGKRGRLHRSIKALYEGGKARVNVEGMES